MGRESGQGNGGKGTFIIGNIYWIMHKTGLKSMYENLIRSMHENVNEYADDLNKLFFKQTVSQDLSIGKSAHTYI